MKFLAFALFLITLQGFAQPKPLFKIVSCSEGVMVDGVGVEPNDVIYSDSKKLEIPKGGYAGVITKEGYTGLFHRRVSVKLIPESIRYNLEPRLKGYGAVHRPIRYFEIAGEGSHNHSELYGDSILIAFKCNCNDKPPFGVTFFNLFDEVKATYQIAHTWSIFSVRSLLEDEPALLFQIRSESRNSDLSLMIKKINDRTKVQMDFDSQRLTQAPVSLLALFEINKLFFDHLYQLYKIETAKPELNLDEFLAAYLARTRERYHLEEYLTK
jgi:hypothetical protein